jgi:spermidine/putrescine transport system permease protein
MIRSSGSCTASSRSWLVLAYAWIPFVALPIFVSLDNMDRSLLEAARRPGVQRLRTFWRVTLPLSLPGLLAGFVFVFVPTIGEFVTPLLVGGTSGYMYGNAIQDLFTAGLDWQSGSVLAMFLLLVVAGLMALFGRYVQVRSVAAD